MHRILKHKLLLIAVVFASIGSSLAYSPVVSAINACGDGKNNTKAYTPSIEIGCVGKGNPIADASFAIIRFLSAGVGLVVVGSMIYGGIQYTMSRGDPQATANAVTRIQSTLIALLIFIFGYAFLNYILPAGFLQ